MSRNSERRSVLRVSLSNLMLRPSDEWQDDPKYATLPQCHFEEIRPSILERYRYVESLPKFSERYAPTLSTLTTDPSDPKFDHRITRVDQGFRSKLKSTSEWSIEPYLHYCASKLKCTKSSSTDASDSKRAAFEVLPPLFESCTHTLLYQNSYLLDGVKYEHDFEAKKDKNPAVNDTKLRLNYLKFFKSVNKKRKPSDCEVIFGDAVVICKPPPRWETSRIDWLLSLEKQHEKRMQACKETSPDEFCVTTRTESFFDFCRRQKQNRKRAKKMCKACKKEWPDEENFDEITSSVSSTDGSKCTTRFLKGNQKKFSKGESNKQRK